eukprot:CAMPEP_0119083742 /NCGR_PEP_ID=MMETSP1178-20130426/126794_1 /TAXON_ID=33656 /ORGANISM="unid sp, Strain CCMP2000" /LENGTH=33 /DNA_ID= /DNA_START= /DNA_END= /DNA_ORIENTATION=
MMGTRHAESLNVDSRSNGGASLKNGPISEPTNS